jgi:hypothetical protein
VIVGRSIAIELAEIYSFSTKGVEDEPPEIHNLPPASVLAESISEDFKMPGAAFGDCIAASRWIKIILD